MHQLCIKVCQLRRHSSHWKQMDYLLIVIFFCEPSSELSLLRLILKEDFDSTLHEIFPVLHYYQRSGRPF